MKDEISYSNLTSTMDCHLGTVGMANDPKMSHRRGCDLNLSPAVRAEMLRLGGTPTLRWYTPRR